MLFAPVQESETVWKMTLGTGQGHVQQDVRIQKNFHLFLRGKTIEQKGQPHIFRVKLWKSELTGPSFGEGCLFCGCANRFFRRRPPVRKP